MKRVEIKVDRDVSVSVNGLKKTVHVSGTRKIELPETWDDAVSLLGSEEVVIKKLSEIIRIREQDRLAKELAEQKVAPEKARLKKIAEKLKSLDPDKLEALLSKL